MPVLIKIHPGVLKLDNKDRQACPAQHALILFTSWRECIVMGKWEVSYLLRTVERLGTKISSKE
jgi:hypothetical protein